MNRPNDAKKLSVGFDALRERAKQEQNETHVLALGRKRRQLLARINRLLQKKP